MEESPEFARMKALAARHPFTEVIRDHRVAVLAGIGALAATGCFNGLFFAHMPAYLSAVLGYDPRTAVVAQTTAVIVHALAILAVGRLASRVAPHLLMRIGALGLVLLAYPFYLALAGKTVPPLPLLVGAGLVAALVNGTFAFLLTDLFPTRIRFSGVALSFNVAFTLFSGTAPLVATTLIRELGTPAAPALVMIGSAVLTLAASAVLHKRGGHVLGQRRDGVAA